MTEQEAISFLGGDEDHVDEFVTQEVFDLKTNLLKGAIVPQVVTKKAEKLDRMADALAALGYEDERSEAININLELSSTLAKDLVHFYRDFEQKMSQLKLRLMQSFHPRITSQILMQLAELEANKFICLANLFANISNSEEIKLSEYIDSGVILSELKQLPESTDLLQDADSFPTLKKEIDKSAKYCKFVEAKKNR